MSISLFRTLTGPSRTLALCLLLTCCLGVAVEAGCPHCQAIVRVDVELVNGRAQSGYFEYHPEILPSVSDADGNTRIPLDRIPADFYRSDKIRLLDTVFVLPGLGKFARPSDIDSVPVTKITSMTLKSWLTKPAADRVHIVTDKEIRMLESPDLVRFDTTIDLSVVHYVGPGDSVSEEELKDLAEHRDFLGSQQDHLLDHLLILIREMQNRVDDSDFAGYLQAIVDQKRSALVAERAKLDTLTDSGVVGHHLAVVREHVAEWTDFLTAILKYLREDDRELLDSEIAGNLAANRLPSDIGDHPYEMGGEVSRAGMTYLLQAYVRGNLISNELGADYAKDLNAHGIYVFKQAFD